MPPTYRLTLVELPSDIILEVWDIPSKDDIPHDLESEIRRNMEANDALRKEME